MHRNLFLPICVLTAFLCSCSLAPKYIRPPAPVPSQWPTGAAYLETTADTLAPPASKLPWREFFTDERLQKIIKMAIDNNRDLRVAVFNVERARAYYGVARAELLPSVNVVGSMYKERIPADLSSTGKSTTSKEYSVNLGVSSWEIDFFGRIRSLKDRVLEEYLATDQSRRSAQIMLVSSVANAYLILAADRENLKLAVSTLETQEAMYKLIRKRYDVGIASELDLRRSQSQVDTARKNVAGYTQLTALDENTLNLLVGCPISKDLLPQELNKVKPFKDIAIGLSSESLLFRPDVLAAEHRLKAANANIGAARAAFFPRIYLTSAVGTASAEFSGLFKDTSATWNFIPLITIPIFDARTWSAYDVTKAEKEISIAQYERTIQTAFREVADALAVRGTVQQQIAAQQSLVDAVAETYRLSNALYTNGMDSYLSVLDAQRSLYDAQNGLINLRLNFLTNLVDLYKALGGG